MCVHAAIRRQSDSFFCSGLKKNIQHFHRGRGQAASRRLVFVLNAFLVSLLSVLWPHFRNFRDRLSEKVWQGDRSRPYVPSTKALKSSSRLTPKKRQFQTQSSKTRKAQYFCTQTVLKQGNCRSQTVICVYKLLLRNVLSIFDALPVRWNCGTGWTSGELFGRISSTTVGRKALIFPKKNWKQLWDQVIYFGNIMI